MAEIDNDIATAEDEAQRIAQEEQLALNFLHSMQIHAKDRFDKPKFTLSKNGIGFAPLGNIMAICAEMKMGKSWLMQQMACAILKGEFMGLQCALINDDGTPVPTSVLYIDTEQDKYDTQMVMRRIQYICNWDFYEDNPRLNIFSMRDFDKLDETKSMQDNRLTAIDVAIKHYRPTVVFIDGVRDLIVDFNELSESAALVQHLMSLSTQYECSIWSVLHVNPNSDKMRGHLGTELGNKTTDVFSVHKDKDPTTNEITFEVKQVAARHRDVDDWLFKIEDRKIIDKNGNERTYAVPVLLDGTEARKKQLKIIFDDAFGDIGIKAMSWTDMYDKVHDKYKKRREVILGWLKDGKELGMIVESCGQYLYNKTN